MANTRLFLDSRRTKEGQKALLKIAIAQKEKTAYITLDVKLLPGKEWDPVKERVINHPEKLTLNSYIAKVRSQIDSFILQLTNEGRINSLTASKIKAFSADKGTNYLQNLRFEDISAKTTF